MSRSVYGVRRVLGTRGRQVHALFLFIAGRTYVNGFEKGFY